MAGTGGKRKGAGRPKGAKDKKRIEFESLITNNDVETALGVLRKKMKDNDTDAAKYILDQKYGKARQRTDLNLEGGIEITVNDYTDEG